jgi:hypothetical protein
MDKEFEALEELFDATCFGSTKQYKQIVNCYNTIEKALTTKSKKEQAFDIIKEKNVDINWFTTLKGTEFYTYERYVSSHKMTKLTQEEFDLLVEVL